ncbi:DUF3310 domain-containing protein [Staphylococcus gallinarum]|uniref:DUF3310 domain-containing protein n=1 Tax=Staphylococcus gallinarum TaxID=1293 RepID=UPI0031719CC1
MKIRDLNKGEYIIFDNGQDYMESNTESVSEVEIKDLEIGDTIQILNNKVPLEGKVVSRNYYYAILKMSSGKNIKITDDSDFKRVRKERKLIDPTKWIEKSNDVQQRKRNDTVNHPSHYNYGEIEIIDVIEQVTKHYNANVAYHIGNAIKYLSRAPHKNGKEDVAKAKWYIERAFENWDK